MWRAGGLLVSLTLLGCLPALQHAKASAQGPTDNVQPVDLTLMALPLEALPSEFAGWQFNQANFAPVDGREAGEINAYIIAYADRSLPPGLPLAVFTGTVLFTNPGTASADYALAVQQFHNNYTNVQSAPIADLGEEAVSLSGDVAGSNAGGISGLRVTAAIFRFGRLIGAAGIFRADSADAAAQTETIARSLYDRMKGVLSGDITTTSALLPPDVNCSGDVNSIDAALLLQLEAALVPSLSCGRIGDSNRDGQLNALDAELILQYGAGLIDHLPI